MTEQITGIKAKTLVEEGFPTQDGRALRRCLGQYPTGVTVVTACHDGQLYGMAVNSFAAVSLDPPLVSWAIRKASQSLGGFTQATHFAVNILSDTQMEVSRRFGAGSPDKFETVRWTAGRGGAPLLEGALVHLECRQAQIYEGGDHLMLLGQVEHYRLFEGAPLLFSQGAYGVARPYPQQHAPMSNALPTGSFLKQLSDVQWKMSRLFDAHRQALGVTHVCNRILYRLASGAAAQDNLAKDTGLEPQVITDALDTMLEKGWVAYVRETDAFELTEAGRHKRAEVAERSASFTREKVKGIHPDDLRASERVLAALQSS